MKPYFETEHGKAILGDSLKHIQSFERDSVDLIVTSPPYALSKPREYGNVKVHEYVEWFKPFGEAFKNSLKDTGSLVIDIGGVWEKGQGTRSLYHFELLIMLVKDLGFHLCQEHYWFNPTCMPCSRWVINERKRVKNAVEPIWWLSKTPNPKSDNMKILKPYSEKYMVDLESGRERDVKSPSGHQVGHTMSRNFGGAIPPNLLAISNGTSNDRYLTYCRENNLPLHPARFPTELPEYFIRFLTDPGDLVVDPFGGSCMTGMVAENLERKWMCFDMSSEYLDGAKGRFFPTLMPLSKNTGRAI